MNTTTYIGMVDGLHTWEVRDKGGAIVGINQSAHLPSETPVPESVTARQIRLYLVRHGITLSQVDDAIAAIPDAQQRQECQVEWDYAPYVSRSHPMLVPLAAALGLTEAQVDDAFREAAGI